MVCESKMVDFFLPFVLGYATARLSSFMISANQETSTNEDNILLKWDKDTFAWRPCPLSMVTDSTAKYMVAAHVDYEVVKFIKIANNSDE